MNKEDLKIGQVCKTQNGNTYVVISTSPQCIDFINTETLNSIGLTNDDMILGSGNPDKKIVEVFEYNAMPDRNKISAALREGQCIGTEFTLTKIWSSQEEEKEKNKNVIVDILQELQNRLDSLKRDIF